MSKKSPWGNRKDKLRPDPPTSLGNAPLTRTEGRTAQNAEENVDFLGIKNW